MPLDSLRRLVTDGFLSSSEFDEINQIRRIRNEIVHGATDHQSTITAELIDRLNEISQSIERRLPDRGIE